MMPKHMRYAAAALLALLLHALPGIPLQAQTDPDQIPIGVEAVRGGVHMVSGAGGNMGVFVGADGIFMVDADYAELSARILETVRSLAEEAGGDAALRYVVNTHWHFDHTGGNAPMAEAGAVLVAHENVARMLSEDRVLGGLGGREVPAAPEEARPVLTFNDRMSFSWNGDLLHMIHMPLAHSNGDVIVHFRDADVIHMGDLFFNGMYPYIDVDFGGDIRGMARAVQEVLDHSNETTMFIPGHGPLGTRSDLQAYGAMLRTVGDRVEPMIQEGKSREDVIASKPTADLDTHWTKSGQPGEADFFVGLVYDGIVRAGR